MKIIKLLNLLIKKINEKYEIIEKNSVIKFINNIINTKVII